MGIISAGISGKPLFFAFRYETSFPLYFENAATTIRLDWYGMCANRWLQYTHQPVRAKSPTTIVTHSESKD